MSINKDDDQGIYYMNPKGKTMEIVYQTCKNKQVKTKIRKFSNLMQKLSQNQEESEEEVEDDYEDEEMMIWNPFISSYTWYIF